MAPAEAGDLTASEANVKELKPPTYLEPYVAAAQRHGAGFGALLWASPRTQAARFDALTRLCHFNGKTILDAGCGRGDFLDYLLARGIEPEHYVGLEAVEMLAAAAERKHHPRCTILRGDFVLEPLTLLVGPDVVLFSGSLNTLEPPEFGATVQRAYEAAGEQLVFNFLCSPALAAAKYLTWHRAPEVVRLGRGLGAQVEWVEDYLPGDCTISFRKNGG